MSEISKIKVKGTKYDLKDAVARDDLLTKQDELTSDNEGEGILIEGGSSGLTTISVDTSIIALKDEIPTRTSDLINDDEFITKDVNNLTNYYKKTETYTQEEVDGLLDDKQDTLVSGTNIKTINNNSLLGSGNIDLESDVFVATYGTTTYTNLKDALDNNKAIVVDMPNNNNSFYITYSTYTAGSDITLYTIFKSGSDLNLTTMTVTTSNSWSVSHDKLQDKLVSGTNIKTINSTSLLGSGDVELNEGKIDKIKVNGTEQTITNKEVDLTVPTKVSDLTNDSNFQTDTDVSSAIDTALANGSDPYLPQSDIQQLIDTEFDNYYTSTEVDTLLDDKADVATTYTKTEVDDLLDDKQDLVSNPTADNILTTNASGQAVDSGKPLSEVGDVTITGQSGGGALEIDLRKNAGNYINFLRSYNGTTGVEKMTVKGRGNNGAMGTMDFYTTSTVDNMVADKPGINIYSNSSTGNKTRIDLYANPEQGQTGRKYANLVDSTNGITIQASDMTAKELVDKTYVDSVAEVDQAYDDTSTKAQSGVAIASALADKADLADIPTLTSELTNDGDGTHNFVTFGDAATDTAFGVVKLNPTQSVTLDSDGKLQVGGRLGQFTNGGVYYPVDIEPSGVGTSSFLMTDGAKGVQVVQRTFAIMAGCGLTCKSTPAGSTTYRVSNNQTNRFILAAVVGGRAALSQADAAANGTAAIVSIKYANGNNLTTPYFGDTESSNDIIVTLEKSINPNAATTQIRVYGKNNSTDNILVGQGVGANGGKALSLGQSTYAGGNQNIAFGNSVYVNANNSVGFGHTMLVNKQYCLGTGQGHDFTNGSNGTTAVGTWSQIGSTTKFAVGNGTASNDRSNIFEVVDNSGQTGLIMKSPNGTRYKIVVDDSGNISATAV